MLARGNGICSLAHTILFILNNAVTATCVYCGIDGGTKERDLKAEGLRTVFFPRDTLVQQWRI